MIKGTRWIAATLVATTLSFAFAPAAHAESEEVVGSGLELIGAGPLKDPRLEIKGAGTLRVKAYDVGATGTMAPQLQALSFSVFNSNSIFMREGAGEMQVDVSGAGLYFLNLNAIPSLQSRFQLGLVSWIATFEPAAVVPLPASVWLLIAGLAWATGMQRSRAKLARNQSVTYVT